jgi:DNA recombination protein RmuC
MVLVIALAGLILLAGLGALVVASARAILGQLRRQAGADRDATVNAAVERVLAVAADRLGDQRVAATQEMDLRSHAIDRQLQDMAGRLQHVGDLVNSLQRDRATQHGELVSRLDQTARSTAALVETTSDLRQALASPKARGQWGERMAEDVLRLAGLVEGVNYRKQTAIAGGTMPDFTFLLPRDLLLHMDVKFPVDNYLRFLEAGNDTDRERCRNAFVKDVRQRVKDLTGRGYADPSTTVGYLIAFIPNESVFGFLHEHDPGLADFALGRGVLLCSPFTLFAVLAVVRQAVDAFVLERASAEILDCLGGLQGQWQKFGDAMDVVGKRLESTQSAFADLNTTRRRQLQRTLDQVDAIRTRRGLEPPPADGEDDREPEIPRLKGVANL